MGKFVDLTGQVFGRLTVMSRAPANGLSKASRWNVLCTCGEPRVVYANSLRSGATRSCGCLKLDVQRARLQSHGLSRTKSYRAWYAMWHRCTNPTNASYANYGGRGISVAPEWADVHRFIEDMGEHPGGNLSLERVDNNLGYSKSNCVWATAQEQTDNRSITRRLTLHGVTKTVKEWADEVGLKYTTLLRRVDDWGWSVEKALDVTVDESRESRKRNTWGQYA